MLKAVPDVNIYISGIIKREGHANQIFKHYRDIQFVTPKVFLEILDQEKVPQ